MMENFQTLQLLDKFERIFTYANIDYKAMRKILEIKLTMDSRRIPTIFNDSKLQEGNQFIKSLGLYAIMGLFLIVFMFGEQYFFQMSLVFGITMFIIMTSMVSDFSTVLLDIRDRTIIGTKPVDSRTINAAKFVHITIYLVLLTIAFAGIPIIFGLFTHGIIFFLVCIVTLVLVNLLVLIVTALLYILVLRFFDGERLKDIINYVQIMLSVTMVAGYQLVIRSFDFINPDFSFTFHWWQLLIPPVWYGALFDIVMNRNTDQGIIILGLSGVIVPIISFIIYLKLIPSFERNLEKLLSESTRYKKSNNQLTKIWSKFLCRNNEEKTFFLFTCRMVKNEREFKLKVYPMLGMAFVFPFIFLLNNLTVDSYEQIQASNQFINIYFSLLLLPSGVLMLGFSENYKGAWIFKAGPIAETKNIHRAALKAFFTKFFLPIFMLLSITFCIIFGIRILLFLLCFLLVASIYAVICYKVECTNARLPFSESYKFVQQGNAIKGILLLVLAGVLGVIHFQLLSLANMQFFYLAVLVILNIFLWRKVM
ncbi:hypothetical protein [Gracilibacillus xinjiangensis]|uniref:ABC transporter permease n=1 Tax=Gracilibacillus xinjiangensis TaxID=1193282 RepID=A0ABV8WS91_9BACI